MDSSSLKAQIKTNSLQSFYIFTGPEVKMMDIYLAQMSKMTNKSVIRLDDVSALVKKSKANSFLDKPHIYVLRDCKDFATDTKVQSFITQNKTFSDDIIVLVYTTIDKRLKFYKSFADSIVEFLPMRTDVLVKYVQKDSELDTASATTLVEICEKDYSRILLELDKVIQYSNRVGVSHNQALSQLISDKTIYDPPYDAIFDFVDAVLRGEYSRAYKLLYMCYEVGEATMVILTNLYTNTKAVLQVQSYRGSGKITESTGLTPFQVKQASSRKGHYSIGDLVYFMKLIKEVETGIKTGVIAEQIAVEYLLAEFWG